MKTGTKNKDTCYVKIFLAVGAVMAAAAVYLAYSFFLRMGGNLSEMSKVTWPGAAEISVLDQKSIFLENSSGLDFLDGRLYAVDNGEACFWILDTEEDGSVVFDDAKEGCKWICLPGKGKKEFQPDTEGITAAADGFLYIAAERDNVYPDISRNMILKVDPNAAGTEAQVLQIWDLTTLLPETDANRGIEAVEWVSFEDMEGRLYDTEREELFQGKAYPEAAAGGIFFVGLEDNGYVYACILNSDGTAVRISDIDSGLGEVVSLDYDCATGTLWAAADYVAGNCSVQVKFNGEGGIERFGILPPSELDAGANYEGFAISSRVDPGNGMRVVYWICDGVSREALVKGYLAPDQTVNRAP